MISIGMHLGLGIGVEKEKWKNGKMVEFQKCGNLGWNRFSCWKKGKREKGKKGKKYQNTKNKPKQSTLDMVFHMASLSLHGLRII